MATKPPDSTTRALLLNKLVGEHRSQLRLERRPMTERRDWAAEQLGFKVSAQAMKAALLWNDIEVGRKKSQQQIRIEELEAENDRLRTLCSKISDGMNIPAWLQGEFDEVVKATTKIASA